ncbi:hypothetical protein GQ44DRAFT_714896 [Phaeosphaeriaceae sp. PMI808]|nr:hypothetical protein GQ44DRAFT_714896 [Phaeosphaeriaceae sp. PMI808]
MDSITHEKVSYQINEAIKNKNVEEFHRLVDSYPEWPTSDYNLSYPHDISTGSFETFKAFVERFPQTKHWDCGEIGNPVGLAAIRGDIPLLKYLLEDLKHKANEGRFFFSPILYSIQKDANKTEIIKILKDHGATLEGEGVCYQRSHRRRNGTVCWHKGGGLKSQCSWSADRSEDSKGLFVWIRNLFAVNHYNKTS